MTSTRRILFISINYSQPAGGVRTVYRHAEILRRHGFQASVLHGGGPDEVFFDTDAHVIRVADGIEFRPDDILVVNEDRKESLDFAGSINLTKVLFLQNQFFMFEGLREGANYSDLGITHYLTGSAWMARVMVDLLGLPEVPIIRYAIDTNRFYPEAKQPKIAFMPRKNPIGARFIRRAFQQRYPEFANVEWEEIIGVPEAEAAERLRKSAIFLSLSRMEGLGLPPLEAMSSGCLPVGFAGDGGKEYMTEKNGLWVEQEDMMGCVHALAEAVRVLDQPDRLSSYLADGARTAGYYNMAGLESDLLAFWRNVVGN
jgi:hypothetical protein